MISGCFQALQLLSVFFSLVLCFQVGLPFSSVTLQLLAVFAFFFGVYILI